MTRFENITKKLTEAFNKRDADAVTKLYANDGVAHDPFYPEPLVGKSAIKEDNEAFIKAFPDLRIEFLNVLEKGDLGTIEMRLTGKNTGTLKTPQGDIPPTGKKIDVRGVSIIRIGSQDLIVEERRYYDTGTFMRQLGLAPEAEAMPMPAHTR